MRVWLHSWLVFGVQPHDLHAVYLLALLLVSDDGDGCRCSVRVYVVCARARASWLCLGVRPDTLHAVYLLAPLA